MPSWPASIDETPRKGEQPRSYAPRIAREKAVVAKQRLEREPHLAGAFVLSADTVVSVSRKIIGKPEYLNEAAEALQSLSGRSHRVYTSVCLVTDTGAVRMRTVETRVRFKRLSVEEMDAYLACGDVARKGWRLCHPGDRGGLRSEDCRLLFECGWPAFDRSGATFDSGEGFPVYFNWLNRAEVDLHLK